MGLTKRALGSSQNGWEAGKLGLGNRQEPREPWLQTQPGSGQGIES